MDGAEEFQQATLDIAGSSGEAMEMADIMNQSLEKTMIRVKTAMLAPLFLSDEMVEINGHMNTFSAHLHNIAELFLDIFVTQLEDGTYQLTAAGKTLQETVIVALEEFYFLLVDVKGIWEDLSAGGADLASILKAFMAPLRLVTKLINIFGDGFIEAVILWKLMNQLIPINSAVMLVNIQLQMASVLQSKDLQENTQRLAKTMQGMTTVYWKVAAAQMGVQAGLLGMMILSQKMPEHARLWGQLAGMIMGAVLAMNAWKTLQSIGWLNPWAAAGIIIATSAILMGEYNKWMSDLMKPVEIDNSELYTNLPLAEGGGSTASTDYGVRAFYTGGFIYADTGLAAGPSHRMVMVEPGERVLSRGETSMGGGITLNIGDVYANDGTDFAEKVAEALPLALRNIDDVGGI